MDFETFLKDLCLNELSDLVYREPDAAEPTEYPSAALRKDLLPKVNMELRQLYIRKQIAQKELVLRTSANITEYVLAKEHALTNAAPDEKYIIDSVGRPYTGDLARVDEILDEQGRPVFNHFDNKMGGAVRRPKWNTLVFAAPLDNVEYLVRYRAAAPVMTEAQTDGDVLLDLPPGYIDYLRKKVAESVYGSQKTQESVAKAAQFRNEASELAAALDDQNVTQDDGWDFSNRPGLAGFR